MPATWKTVFRYAAEPNSAFRTWVPSLFRARRLFFFRCVYPGAAIWCACLSRREALVPGGGRGRLPGACGQAVRALAATARATAALVAAGSARMTTRAPVIVFAVSLGAIQMTRQPEAARRVMSFCPSAC